LLAERFLDDRRLLPALRFDLDLAPFLPLEAERRRDRERPPFDELRFLEQLLFREALRFLDLLRLRDPARFPDRLRLPDPARFPDRLRLRDPARFPDRLRLRDPARCPEQLRLRERLRDLRPLDAERFLLPPLDLERLFEHDFERDRDRPFLANAMAALFMAALRFGHDGLLGLLQLLLSFCSSSSAAAFLDRVLTGMTTSRYASNLMTFEKIFLLR